jgi:hypothetical protein
VQLNELARGLSLEVAVFAGQTHCIVQQILITSSENVGAFVLLSVAATTGSGGGHDDVHNAASSSSAKCCQNRSSKTIQHLQTYD